MVIVYSFRVILRCLMATIITIIITNTITITITIIMYVCPFIVYEIDERYPLDATIYLLL